MYTGAPMEWQIGDQIRRETSDLAKSYEVGEVRRNVDSLEYSLREARAEIDGLRSQLQDVAQGALNMANLIDGLMDRITRLEAREPVV